MVGFLPPPFGLPSDQAHRTSSSPRGPARAPSVTDVWVLGRFGPGTRGSRRRRWEPDERAMAPDSEHINDLLVEDHEMVGEGFRRVLDREPDIDVLGID